MAVRVAMIGCGGVGSLHAEGLIRDQGVELAAVYSPNSEEASSFASVYGIKHICGSLAAAISEADVAIVCSPSGVHFCQARECLEAGVHTLVEMPPCASASEAEELGDLALKRGIRLGCAHTARYLLPYIKITENLRKDVTGEVQEVNYVRYHKLRERSWTDNALLHHAAHPIDMLMDWCGGLNPVGCVALPRASAAQTVSILGKLPNGGPAAITVTYNSHLPHTRMLIVCKKHTVETDGFSYVRSDLAELQFRGIEQDVYKQSVRDQDAEFLGACQGKNDFVGWAETVRLIQTVNRFEALCDGQLPADGVEPGRV